MYQEIEKFIQEKQSVYSALSDQIWDLAETKFHEYQSAEVLIAALEIAGFQVTKNIANMETAFEASYGSEGPVIGFLGEYDALPDMNQKADIAVKEIDTQLENSNGHGCGHNLLGTASLAAAVATKEYIEVHQLKAQIKFFGCPAEEGGSGKTFMARAHAFDQLDMALCWHPGTDNAIIGAPTLANIQASFEFKGKSSHAANSPEMGRSALDAMELMNVGTNYLREHVIQDARFHYAVLNSGGLAPSVVQSSSEVLYLIRAPQGYQAREIYERICKIAEGAALMTETAVTIKFDKACSNYMPNTVYSRIMAASMEKYGAPKFDESDWEFAEKLRNSLTDEEKKFQMVPIIGPVEKELLSKNSDKALANYIYPYNEAMKNLVMPGSTDVGDVSWVVPTAQIIMATEAKNTSLHSWQWVANGKSGIAKKGMLQAAKVMAASAVTVIEHPEYIKEAKAELAAVTAQTPYKNPIPEDVKPNSLDV